MASGAFSLWAQADTQATFEIESIRVIALMTKEDGRCWDLCSRQIQEDAQRMQRAQEAQGRSFREVGTVESERLGARFPTPAELEAYYRVATEIFTTVSGTTYMPEIQLDLAAPDGQRLAYQVSEQNRASAVFSDSREITLYRDRGGRYITVNVWDKDLRNNDRIGYKKIELAESVFEDGGSVVVRFDRVHYMELILRRKGEVRLPSP